MDRHAHRGHATDVDRPVSPAGRRSTWRALDADGTRRSIRALTVLVAALSILFAACAAGAAVSWHADTSPDAFDHRAVPGTVTAVTGARAGARGGVAESNLVVTYVLDDRRYSTSFVAGPPHATAAVGDTVPLQVDERDPATATLHNTATALSAVTIVLTAVAVTLGCVLGWQALKLAARRRVLARNPWVLMEARILEVPAGLHTGNLSRRVVVLDDPTGECVTAQSAGVRRLPLTLSPVAWVAGWGDRFLVAPPGGGPLVPVRKVPVRTGGH